MKSNFEKITQLWQLFNSFPLSAAYMLQGIGSALVQIMACRLFCTKPLSKPTLGYYKLDVSEILVKNWTFSFKKMCLKMLSAKWLPFCSREDELGIDDIVIAVCMALRFPQVASTSRGPFCWIWSPVPWIPSARDLLAKSSAQKTSSLAKVEPGTTGRKVITPRVPSWSILSWISSAKRPRAATVCRASSWHTHLGAAPAPVWAPCSSARSEKSIQTGSWTHSLWCLLLRYEVANW